MAQAQDVAGLISGATASAAVLVLFAASRQRRWLLGAAGLTLLAAALWSFAARTAASSVLAWGPLLGALGLALLLVELAVRALRASQQQRQLLQQQLAQRGRELELSRQHLEQAQHAAELADQAKARFLAAASHDLRQPAHALGLYTAALRAAGLNPEQAEIAQRMQRSLAALDALFAALLDVSRMDAGAVLPQWDTVALAPLLHRLADEWAPQAEARGLRLALHISASGAMTVTDPVLLERVLRNLLANALKYTRSGGLLLACRPRTAADGQRHLRIEVWDSGVGIAAADQARIFEEFFQAGEPAQQPGGDHGRGLGLGLAIVQRLVGLLQLRVVLHSKPGRGSVFFVEGLAPAGAASLAVAASRMQMRRLAGLRVAVLDQDDDARDALRRLLQRWDCQVVDAADASGLLQLQPAGAPGPGPASVHGAAPATTTHTKPDAVVATVGPHGGRAVAAELRRLQSVWGAAVPLLCFSDPIPGVDTQALLPAGCDVLSKPVSPVRLRAWLEQRLTAVHTGDDA